MLRNTVFSLFLFSFSMVFSQSQIKKVWGRVSDGTSPISNVNISVKDTDTGVQSSTDGTYEIYVDEGQTLVYSYVGMRTTEIIVEDITSVLNVTMYPNIEQLDEVVVTKKKKKTQKELLYEYESNKNLIKTGFGILDKDRVGYSLRIFDGDELNPAAIDFVRALQGRLPGVIIEPSPDDPNTPVMYLNTMKKLLGQSAIYEVDGMVYRTAPTFVLPNNIKRVAVIGSLAGASKYGTGSAGGVIVINTKTGNYATREPGTNKPYDLARRRDNYFEKGSAVAISKMAAPKYIEEVSVATSETEAVALYQELEKKYQAFPFFYLDMFSFFGEKWKDDGMQKSIGEEIENKFATDPTVLKALAYLLEEQNQYKWASDLYKQIFAMRPHYAQSYSDLARSYENMGAVESAMVLYARYFDLVEKSLLDSSKTFTPIIKRDVNSLFARQGSLMGSTSVVQTEAEDFDGVRLLFEWNNSETEFELQLVNPENQYYLWEHTMFSNAERIQEEKTSGFSSEDYLFYKPIQGNWTVNVKYLGNKSLTPSYLKATIFYDFGTKNQRKEIKVFKLTAKNINQALFQIKNGSSITTF